MSEKTSSALEPFNNAPEEIQNIVKQVLQLERDKLSQKQPHLVQDVVKIIKEQVQ